MRRLIPCLALLIVLLTAAPRAASRDAAVILVSIDGLAAYHLEDESLELPNIRRMIETGVWARGSQTVFPSVTHPAHTTLLTGVEPRRHGVIGNVLTDRLTGATFHVTNLPRTESVKSVTLFDVARRHNLTTAALFWPETLDDPAIDYNIVESFVVDRGSRVADIRTTDAGLIRELEHAGIPIRLYFEWYPEEHLRGAGDVILTRAATYLISRYQPRLLAIHLLATDVLQHNYGPEHYLARTALTQADFCVGLLFEAVSKAGLLDNTTFVITADHGFHTVPYQVNLQPVFEKAGLTGFVRLHAQGWFLFVEKGEAFTSEAHGTRLEQALEEIEALEGIARIVPSASYPQLGFPTYEENRYVRGQWMIVAQPDVYLAAEAGGDTRPQRLAEPHHSHGYLPSFDRMEAALVLAGRGVRQGQRIERTDHLSIAPTISHLLGIDTVGDAARILHEALAAPGAGSERRP